jgi:hypothetical protein
MADELTDFSKSRWEAVFQAWEQLLRVRHLGDMVEVQTRYAQGAYDAYMSEMYVPGYSTQCRHSSKGHREKVQLVRCQDHSKSRSSNWLVLSLQTSSIGAVVVWPTM